MGQPLTIVRLSGLKGSFSVQTANEGQVTAPAPRDGAMREAGYEPPQAVADDARYSMETRLIRTLLHAFGNPPIAFHLWNGDRVAPLDSAPVATLHIPDRRTLVRLCTDPDLQFGELYSAGRINVDGSILRMIEELYLGAAEAAQPISLRRRFAQWRHRRPRNTLTGSRENIHHHYDIGNDFYTLWLGDTMAYTCAYYPRPDATLDEAQLAKFEHVCRKLQLRAGETVAAAPVELVLDELSISRYTAALRPAHRLKPLHMLQAEIDGAVARQGIALREGYHFSPHLTLRYHGGDLVHRPIFGFRWVAQEFVLIESFVGLSHYEVHGRWPLRAPEDPQGSLFPPLI